MRYDLNLDIKERVLLDDGDSGRKDNLLERMKHNIPKE